MMFFFREQPMRHRQDHRRRAWVQRTALLCGFPRVPNRAQLLRRRRFPDSFQSSCSLQALRDALRPTCNSVTLCNTYLKTRQMSLPGAVLYVASSCNGTANWKVWQSVTNAVTFDLPSSGCKSHLVLTSATCPFPDAQGMKKSCSKNTRQRESEREREGIEL